MTISINQITSGLGLRLNNDIYIVTEYHHVKPGKGAAFVRVKLKNFKSDLTIERTYKSSEKLEDVFLEQKTLQYLYRSQDIFHFMDQHTFEESVLSRNQLGDVISYLQENADVTAIFCEHKLQKVTLPNFIIAQIVETEPGFKGDTSKAGTKPAKIDAGAIAQVPLFINQGDWIKIDTRTGQYVERVQK
ncbi:MAG: elongation factor P [Candidatus Omnitrophota bacterium]